MPCAHGKKTWSFATKSQRIPRLLACSTPNKLARTFDYTRQLGNVDAIFKRVLGESDQMNQIPDHAAERVLGTIQEVIELGR